MSFQLRVLGPPQVLDKDGNPVSLSLGKPLALLVYVACHERPVSRDEVADLLWPDAGRQKGRHSVRQALWVLKNALGVEVLEGQDLLSVIDGVISVDLEAFRVALARGEVEKARELWRGSVLDHFGLAGVRRWNHWVEDLRADVERRFGAALLHYAQDLRDQGKPEEASELLDLAIQVCPGTGSLHITRVELLLELMRPDAARSALSNAQHLLEAQPQVADSLQELEGRLDHIIQEQRSRITEGETFPMEFVGRSRELAELHSLWREAQAGQCRVAVVTGASGVGKTRLAREFQLHVLGQTVGSVQARGTRGEMKLRWGTASQLVRELLALPGSAGISSGSDSLLKAMLPSLGRNAVNLQTVNGVNPAAILDAVTDLLESVTFEIPLVVQVDDFQWVDPESRTLLLGLANRCRNLRLFLLFAGRSDLSSRHWEKVEELLVSEAGAVRLALEPLIEEEVGELLALGAAFSDPEEAREVVRRIHQTSGGNPLFIREILKEIHEKGILEREEEGWVFQTFRMPQEFELPENIRYLLQERLDRLSEPAAMVAVTLARAHKSVPSETLQVQTQLPPKVFTQAVAELLERGVVEWVDGTRLDFIHDLLRDTADLHLSGSLPDATKEGSWLSKPRWMVGLTAGIMLALPVGILWGSGALPRFLGMEARFGGGVIVLQRQDGTPLLIQARPSPPEEWTPEEIQPPPPPETDHIFRGSDGNLVLFGIQSRPSGPDIVRILDGGTFVPVFPDSGDQRLMDFEPHSSQVLFLSENIQDEELFSHSLYEGTLSTGERKRIYKGEEHVDYAAWSPDGDLIALVARAQQDTLILMSRQADRVAAITLGDVSGLTWCGSRILTAASREDEALLLSVSVPDMAVDTVARLVAGGARPTCSPDGTAAAYVAVVDQHLRPVVLDLTSGSLHLLPEVDGVPLPLSWLPDEAPPVPADLEISGDTLPLDMGSEVPLSAQVTYTDGSVSVSGIQWTASDPSVATVTQSGRVTANGVGTSRIVASRGFSLADTLVVEVLEFWGEGTLFRDEFTQMDTTLWVPVGNPPVLDTLPSGETALRFTGAEKYSDGLVLSNPFPLSRGITLEFEFLFNPNRPVHQNLGISIRDMEIDRDGLKQGFLAAIAGASAVYPGREMTKFDPAEVRLVTSPGRETTFRIPEALPSDDWVHMALQVRADGEVALVLDRQKIGTSPVVIDTHARHAWHLVLLGDAIGVDMYVRNLTVWPGERY